MRSNPAGDFSRAGGFDSARGFGSPTSVEIIESVPDETQAAGDN